MDLVRESKETVGNLDVAAKSLKDAHWPRPSLSTIDRLRSLQSEKEEIVLDVIGSLPDRLGATDAHALSAFVHDEFKSQMRIIRGPRTPVGGFGGRGNM